MIDFLKMLVVSLIVLFLPGYLLLRLLSSKIRLEIYEKIPLSFFLTIGLVIIPIPITYLLKLNFNFVFYATVFVTLLLLILNIRKNVKLRGVYPALSKKCGATPKQFINLHINTIGLLIILAASSILMFKQGAFLYPTSDCIWWMTITRRTLTSKLPLITDCYYKGLVDPTTAYNIIWPILVALIVKISKIDIVRVWSFLPGILTPLSLLAIYMFAKILFKDRKTAFLSAFSYFSIFIISQGYLAKGKIPWHAIIYTSPMATYILLPIMLWSMWKYIYSRDNRLLLLGGILGFTLAVFHIFYFLLFFLSGFSFLVFYYLFKKQDIPIIRSLRKFLWVTFLVGLPFLILRYFTSYGIIDLRWCTDRVIFLSKNLFIIDFFKHVPHTFFVFPAIIIFSIILTPLLLAWTKKDNSAIFLFSNMVVPLLIVFNPFLASPLSRAIMSLYVARIMRIMPYFLVFGFFLTKLLNFTESKIKCKISSVVVICVISILFIKGFNGIKYINRFNLLSPCRKAASILKKDKIPTDTVIFSDPLTCYNLPVFVSCHVNAIPTHKTSAIKANQVQRIQDVKDVLNSTIGIPKTLAILKKYSAKYLIIMPKYFYLLERLKYRDFDKGSTSNFSIKKFEKHKEFFEKIYDENNIYIYRINYNE